MKLRNPGITTIIPSLKKLESPVIEGISALVSHVKNLLMQIRLAKALGICLKFN